LHPIANKSAAGVPFAGGRDFAVVSHRRSAESGIAREYPPDAGAVADIIIILALILLNGLFALSELAVVSARRQRLRAMAAEGRRGAQSALALADSPSRFLSAVQIGITCIGIVNGAYSGEAVGPDVAAWLQQMGMPADWARPLAFGAVVAAITYLSVVIGELVPKTLALRNAEVIACTVAPAMALLARAGAPVVWLLDYSTRLFLRLLGQSAERRSTVTDEEIRELIAEAERTGIVEAGEQSMIAGVMRLADRSVVGAMTPRADVHWIDLSSGEGAIRNLLIATPHSRLPVGRGSPDSLDGVVQTRELLSAMLAGRPFDVERYMRRAPVIPDIMDALDAITVLRESEVPMALIHDEYGHFEGLVTPADILEAITGVFRSDIEGERPHATERDDGSWLISGAMPVDEMAALLGIVLPAQRNYQTVAGFMLVHLQHMPDPGEWIETLGWRFEVIDLDGRRIDAVLASRRGALPHRPS